MKAEDQSLIKQLRLSKSAEIKTVRFKGERFFLKPFTVFYYHNELRIPRIAIALTSQSGNSVVRNRAKRLIRECFRKKKKDLGNFDILIYSNHKLDKFSREDLRELVERIFRRLSEKKSSK